jgi:hypothetical protein
MNPQKFKVTCPGQRPIEMTAHSLGRTANTTRSWVSFVNMLLTGEPAVMTAVDKQGRHNTMVVTRLDEADDRAPRTGRPLVPID